MTLADLALSLPELIAEAKIRWGEEDQYYNTDCDCDGAGVRIHPLQDIHSLDCAKAFSERGYKYHLTQMLTSPDPELYYMEHANDSKIK